MQPDVASVAALIGDTTRATILSALMGGEALPASELAYRAHVTPQTVSAHLTKLMAGNLVSVTKVGRHRYYALASEHVARTLEALQVIAPQTESKAPRAKGISPELCHARTCYDHMAGRLGVAITEAMLARELISLEDDRYTLSERGHNWLANWNIDVAALHKQRRKFAYPCVDWSERRFHLAGSLGTAIATLFFDEGWVKRLPETRALAVTAQGDVFLEKEFGIVL